MVHVPSTKTNMVGSRPVARPEPCRVGRWELGAGQSWQSWVPGRVEGLLHSHPPAYEYTSRSPGIILQFQVAYYLFRYVRVSLCIYRGSLCLYLSVNWLPLGR